MFVQDPRQYHRLLSLHSLRSIYVYTYTGEDWPTGLNVLCTLYFQTLMKIVYSYY